MTPPPTPFHLLRCHQSPLSSLTFNPSNTLLYSADQAGYISITDLRTRRVISYWKAHADGVLGVQEWDDRLIRSVHFSPYRSDKLMGEEGSHGRDNLIHLYHPYRPSVGNKEDHPKVEKSLDVNALNFCRFSLAEVPGKGKGKERKALLAVPNLVNSELADIHHLPSMKRLHSSINGSFTQEIKSKRSGLIMSLHVAFLDGRLAIVMGFEDGRVEMWTCSTAEEGWSKAWDGRMSEKRRWKRVWEGKGHNEAGQLNLHAAARGCCNDCKRLT